MRWMAVLCLGALASGCSKRGVYVRYGEVHRHLGELRRDGQATVATIEAPADALYAPVVGAVSTAVVALDRPVAAADKPTTLRALAKGCRDLPPFRGGEGPHPCGLVVHRDTAFLVRTRWKAPARRDVIVWGVAGTGIAAIAGAGVCSQECENHGTAKAWGLAIGGAVLLLTVALQSAARN